MGQRRGGYGGCDDWREKSRMGGKWEVSGAMVKQKRGAVGYEVLSAGLKLLESMP